MAAKSKTTSKSKCKTRGKSKEPFKAKRGADSKTRSEAQDDYAEFASHCPKALQAYRRLDDKTAGVGSSHFIEELTLAAIQQAQKLQTEDLLRFLWKIAVNSTLIIHEAGPANVERLAEVTKHELFMPVLKSPWGEYNPGAKPLSSDIPLASSLKDKQQRSGARLGNLPTLITAQAILNANVFREFTQEYPDLSGQYFWDDEAKKRFPLPPFNSETWEKWWKKEIKRIVMRKYDEGTLPAIYLKTFAYLDGSPRDIWRNRCRKALERLAPLP